MNGLNGKVFFSVEPFLCKQEQGQIDSLLGTYTFLLGV